nr:restriction endonuclease subunit S [Megasphaera stantonii]
MSWEQRKLGELGTITTGNTPSTSIPGYYSSDGIIWVTPTDIVENITVKSARKLSPLGQKVGRVVPQNTILVTCIASIGKNTMLGIAGSFNQQINGLTPNENKYNPYFLLTESFLWSVKMKNSAAAGTMQIVNRTEFSELKTWLPSLKEQKQIGSFFQQLDNLITLHQRKYLSATNIKKMSLLKFFSLLIRKLYRQFTNSWKQRKFKDIAGTRRGLTYKPTDITDRGIRVLRSSNINEDCFEIHDDDVLVNEDVVNIPYAKNGDILITSANGSSKLIGKHAIIHDIQEKSTVPGGFMLIASSDEPEFINASMSSPWYTKFINVFVSGGNGSIGNLSKVDLDEQYILVPCKEEREKIGSYFSNLDNLITLHQHENLKGGLL